LASFWLLLAEICLTVLLLPNDASLFTYFFVTRIATMSSAMGTTPTNAANAAGNLESNGPTSLTSKKWARSALLILIALLAIVAVSIAVGVDNDRKIVPDPPVTQAVAQEAKPVKEKDSSTISTEGPKAVPSPKPSPKPAPPKKEGNGKTMIPTMGLTATVSTEITSSATVPDRGDRRSMIQSPTWRG